MDDEMEDANGRVDAPARLAGLAVGDANEAPHESRFSWAGDDDTDVAADRSKVQALRRISPVYWAAKTMICSSQLKEHVRSSRDLSLTLERNGDAPTIA
jgi:hypothetical protein